MKINSNGLRRGGLGTVWRSPSVPAVVKLGASHLERPIRSVSPVIADILRGSLKNINAIQYVFSGQRFYDAAVFHVVRRYLSDVHWKRQHRWRHAIWRGMASLGLTGLHVLPVHDRWVEIHRRLMPLVGLGTGFDGFRIVQISDLHYSPVVLRGYLRQMIDIVNRQSPDVVVVTGDLLTGGHQFVRGITSLLTRIQAREQVIVTFGNHDYTMAGKRNPSHGQHLSDRLEAHLEKHGLNVLRNERTTMRRGDDALTIVGLDDEWTGRLRPDEAFAEIDESHPILCLNHNPVNAGELLDYPWQWMLAGHTHGRPLEGRHLYVNRGLSYGNRRRRSNRPEITVFRLIDPARSGKLSIAQDLDETEAD
jgi:uncharacterized protein